MGGKRKDEILHDHNHDGIDRRGFLKCMAWAGTGAFCVMQGGVLKSYSMSRLSEMNPEALKGGLSFVQISDSHMGFNKPANPDVAATLKAAVDKINALATPPEFLLHTGDISHLSKPEEFDTVDQILKSASAKDVFFVPGEHDVLNDDGQQYRERYAKGSKGSGWYSFDRKGLHFIGLVNVMNLKAGGLGTLGHDQLEWLEDDVKHLKSSTPIVVFAHIPLWAVYPEWGWGTEDSGQALAYLREKPQTNKEFRFSKPSEREKSMRRSVFIASLVAAAVMGFGGFVTRQSSFAASAQEKAATSADVKIVNFSFGPATLSVTVGTTVTWTNRDDIPHTVVSTDKVFKSKVLDTDEKFSYTFTKAGTYPYFCSIHPKMTGQVVVQ